MWGSDGQGILVDENGEFETTFQGDFSILPGMFGDDLTGQLGVDGIGGLTLRGKVVSHDLICGEAQGTFLTNGEPQFPFEFGMSTFAATRLDSDVLNNYDGPYPTFGEDMLLGCP